MNRVSTWSALSVGVALLVAVVAASDSSAPSGDFFLAYKTKATKGAPAFTPVTLRLADRAAEVKAWVRINSSRSCLGLCR